MNFKWLTIKYFTTFLIFSSICLSTNNYAKDLGVIGQTYPIIEVNFLEFIQLRMKDMEKHGQWHALQNKMQEKAKNYRDRPQEVAGIHQTGNKKSWLLDPSITLDHNVYAANGNIIALAGSHVNPLEHITMTRTLIFYDADNTADTKWALNIDKTLKGMTKLILVKGSLLEEEKRFHKPIYFDQSGNLTKHFGITHVPALVFQEGTLLRVMEVIT